MTEINIARTIMTKRKEKGLTQDELASFVGVSKASVSKWETGQSFPDIVLLPQLAAYFDISIDDLMGYEPQMVSQDIRKLYKELSLEFTQKPVDEVLKRCRDITKKYFSCFPLLLQIGALYINYGYYTVTTLDDEQKAAIVAEAKELFVRIKDLCSDIDLRQVAIHLIGMCELLLGNPDEVIQLFEHSKNHAPIHNELLLSQAYLMTGRVQEAKTELQGSIYESVATLLGTVPSYLKLYTDDPIHFDEICRRTMETIHTWNANRLLPVVVLPFYIGAAAGYLAHENTEKALAMVEAYVNLATSNIFPLTLKGDDFFNLMDFSQEPPFGSAELPRDEKSIKQSLVDGIANNPALEALYENQRFANMVKRIKNIASQFATNY